MPLTSKQVEKLWDLLKLSLSKKMSPKQYKAWIQNSTKLVSVEDNIAVIAVNNRFSYNWIAQNADKLIKDVFYELLGSPVKLEYKVNPSIFKTKIKKEADLKGTILDPSLQYSTALKRAIAEAGINPKYTFMSFVVGANSQLAHAAAVAVANSPGDSYNPLFIYGPTGVGKTHLMQAIGNEILKKDPNKKVYYCSSETFLNSMVEGIRNKKTTQFRQRYRKLDLLMIDDIQFISKWQGAQDELFHTFNVLYNAGKQIVLVSDRPPSEIQGLADRLRSRFEGGMVVDISIPDYETRVAILASVNRLKSPRLSLQILEKIASLIDDNVRVLIGSYNKIYSYTRLTDTKVDLSMVEKILGLNSVTNLKKINPDQIIKAVAESFGVSAKDILSKSRMSDIILPRHVCMYLIRSMLDYSLEKTATALNRKDHTTVLHAISKVQELMDKDSFFRDRILKIKNHLIKS